MAASVSSSDIYRSRSRELGPSLEVTRSYGTRAWGGQVGVILETSNW